MSECLHIRPHLVDMVREGADAPPPPAAREHLSECAACSAELRVIREVWAELPPAATLRPPAALRDRVLARARDAVLEPQASGVKRVIAEMWRAVRPAATQVGAAVAAAGAVIGLLQLGGGLAIRGAVQVLLLGLLLAVLFGAALGGMRSRRAVRTVLLGGLASVGGYLFLSLLHPIPRAVEFCQLRIFRDPAMPLGQICLVYAAVASLYAGLPVAVASHLSAAEDGWAAGLAEAAVFTLLAAPILVLQFGVESLAITGTVLAGAAIGAAAGGLAGRLPDLRSRFRGAHS